MPDLEEVFGALIISHSRFYMQLRNRPSSQSEETWPSPTGLMGHAAPLYQCPRGSKGPSEQQVLLGLNVEALGNVPCLGLNAAYKLNLGALRGFCVPVKEDGFCNAMSPQQHKCRESVPQSWQDTLPSPSLPVMPVF